MRIIHHDLLCPANQLSPNYKKISQNDSNRIKSVTKDRKHGGFRVFISKKRLPGANFHHYLMMNVINVPVPVLTGCDFCQINESKSMTSLRNVWLLCSQFKDISGEASLSSLIPPKAANYMKKCTEIYFHPPLKWLHVGLKVLPKLPEILIASFVSSELCCLWSQTVIFVTHQFPSRSCAEAWPSSLLLPSHLQHKWKITKRAEARPATTANLRRERGRARFKEWTLKSWSGYLPTEWNHHHLHHHHKKPLFLGSEEAKIIGFFPTNNAITPELN